MPDMYDVVIIGGGPAGATAAAYSSRAKLRTLVVDKSMSEGALALTARIENYPGVPGDITGEELLKRMRAQAETFGARFVKATVQGASLEGETKMIYTPEGEFQGRAVIVATGGMGRKAMIPGEAELLGKGVSYCATCDGAFFTGTDVAVIGDGEHALEETLFLTKYANKIALISSRRTLDGPGDLLTRIGESGKVELMTEGRVAEIRRDRKGVSGILYKGKNEERVIPVKGVFIYLKGNAPATDFLRGLLDMKGDGCIVVDDDMMTSAPGVYAVGDAVCSQLKQAVIAAADGAKAAMAADKYINKLEKISPAKYY